MKWIQTVKGWVVDVVLLFIFSFFLYALLLAPNGMPLYSQVKKLRNAQQGNLDLIRKEQLLIQNNKELLERDDEYFDKEARMVWGYVKPKEMLYWYSDMGEEDVMEEHE